MLEKIYSNIYSLKMHTPDTVHTTHTYTTTTRHTCSRDTQRRCSAHNTHKHTTASETDAAYTHPIDTAQWQWRQRLTRSHMPQRSTHPHSSQNTDRSGEKRRRRQWRRQWWRWRRRRRRRRRKRWPLRRGDGAGGYGGGDGQREAGRLAPRTPLCVRGGISRSGAVGVPHPEGIIGRKSAGGHDDLQRVQRGDQAGLWPRRAAVRTGAADRAGISASNR